MSGWGKSASGASSDMMKDEDASPRDADDMRAKVAKRQKLISIVEGKGMGQQPPMSGSMMKGKC